MADTQTSLIKDKSIRSISTTRFQAGMLGDPDSGGLLIHKVNYDPNGLKLEEIEYNEREMPERTVRFKYDDHGRQTEARAFVDGMEMESEVNTYDEEGNLIAIRTYYSGELGEEKLMEIGEDGVTTIHRSYDDEGEVEEEWVSGPDLVEGKWGMVSADSITEEYDERDNLILFEERDQGELVYRRESTYDDKDQMTWTRVQNLLEGEDYEVHYTDELQEDGVTARVARASDGTVSKTVVRKTEDQEESSETIFAADGSVAQHTAHVFRDGLLRERLSFRRMSMNIREVYEYEYYT